MRTSLQTSLDIFNFDNSSKAVLSWSCHTSDQIKSHAGKYGTSRISSTCDSHKWHPAPGPSSIWPAQKIYGFVLSETSPHQLFDVHGLCWKALYSEKCFDKFLCLSHMGGWSGSLHNLNRISYDGYIEWRCIQIASCVQWEGVESSFQNRLPGESTCYMSVIKKTWEIWHTAPCQQHLYNLLTGQEVDRLFLVYTTPLGKSFWLGWHWVCIWNNFQWLYKVECHSVVV